MKQSVTECHIFGTTNSSRTDKFEFDGNHINIKTSTGYLGVEETNEGVSDKQSIGCIEKRFGIIRSILKHKMMITGHAHSYIAIGQLCHTYNATHRRVKKSMGLVKNRNLAKNTG